MCDSEIQEGAKLGWLKNACHFQSLICLLFSQFHLLFPGWLSGTQQDGGAKRFPHISEENKSIKIKEKGLESFEIYRSKVKIDLFEDHSWDGREFPYQFKSLPHGSRQRKT
jgi:hypothetical protein